VVRTTEIEFAALGAANSLQVDLRFSSALIPHHVARAVVKKLHRVAFTNFFRKWG
jgi:hypothetical protein